MAEKPVEKPTVGRVVHVEGASGRCLAAVVVAEDAGGPTLQVFLPEADEGGRHQTLIPKAVHDDADKPSPGTWHWPERA